MKLKKLITIKEASEYIGVHTTTLRRWEKQGELKPFRIGNRKDRRYTKEMLINLISEHN